MAFANAEEVYKVFGLTLDKMKTKDAKLYKELGDTNIIFSQKIPNLDASITLEMTGGEIKPTYGPCNITVDASSDQNDDVFVKFWQGKLNLMMAMAKGQVKAKGAMTKLLKLLPKITPIYKYFVESLKEAGREDLVIK